MTELSASNKRPTRRHAALTSLLLCSLFFIVYGGCNYLTSLRSDVGTWVYAWERYIPFVPLMIVPYMSIDLFFVGAPFLCDDRRELRVLARRIVMAILVAGVVFLAMPLRFTFERPHVDGVLGVVFNKFREMDKPFNQLPSLHIALRTILAATYARHARRPWLRAALSVWFSLIGASTLLVYQHHVVDVVGGFVLAALCFYAFGESPWRSPVSRNRRAGVIYGAATLVLVLAAVAIRGWGLLLLWPALGTLLVTMAYAGLGPAVYRKTDGRLPLSARVVLGPVLFAQYLSLRHYARRSNPWDRVSDRVWIGRALGPRLAAQAAEQGVVAVLDLTSEFAAPAPFRRLRYLNLSILDLTAPLPEHFERGVEFIEQHAAHGVVYVHCKAGYSRSAAVVAAYLLRAGLASDAQAAVEQLRAARPGIIIRPEALAAITQFAGQGTPRETRDIVAEPRI